VRFDQLDRSALLLWRIGGIGQTSTFMSSRLRTTIGLVAIELPAAQASRCRERGRLKRLQLGRDRLVVRQLLQVVAHRLVEALAHGPSRLARLLGNAFIDGQSDVHGAARTACVNTQYADT
jgi:hypothetical protein